MPTRFPGQLTLVEDETETPVTRRGTAAWPRAHSTRRERALRDVGAPVNLAVTTSFAEADSLEVLDPVVSGEDVLWPWLHRLADDLTDGTAGRRIEEHRPSQVM